MSDTILVVDDETNISGLVRIALEREGFERVVVAGTVAEAVALARSEQPALVVLDVNLPDGSGFDAAMSIRRFSEAPILFLTARDSDLDKLTGFGVGGDDYVTKPFNPLEVAARVKAHLRRARGVTAEGPCELDDGRVVVDEPAARLTVGGVETPMPAREFKLLAFLAHNPDRVFSAQQLYRQVWADEPMGSADENTVSVHIRRVREKVERDAGSPEMIVTIRGLGYKLAQRPAGA